MYSDEVLTIMGPHGAGKSTCLFRNLTVRRVLRRLERASIDRTSRLSEGKPLIAPFKTTAATSWLVKETTEANSTLFQTSLYKGGSRIVIFSGEGKEYE